jgi:hypothetical protein
MTSSRDWQELKARMDGLEARSRRLRSLAVAGWVALLSLVLLGQAGPGNRLEGQELVLSDDAGTRRVVLAAGSGGSPVIALLDDKGQIRAGLQLRNGAPGLFLNDATGQESLRVAVTENGPEVFLYDDRHVARTGFAVRENIPGMFLRDGAQQDRLNITVQDGGPAIFLNDENGQGRLSLAVPEKPIIVLSDEAGQARMSVVVDLNGNPSVNFRDDKTNAMARFGITDSEPELVMIEKAGNRIFEAP